MQTDIQWRDTYEELTKEIMEGEVERIAWLQRQMLRQRIGELPKERALLMESVLGPDWEQMPMSADKLNILELRKDAIEAWKQDAYAPGKIVHYKAYDSFYRGMIMPSEKTTEGWVKLAGLDGFYGSQHMEKENCYPTREALAQAEQEKLDTRKADILSNIRDIKDLVQYMYDNPVCPGEEYTDWAGRAAVREAAKNMLGIDLEHPQEQAATKDELSVPVLSDADLKALDDMDIGGSRIPEDMAF